METTKSSKSKLSKNPISKDKLKDDQENDYNNLPKINPELAEKRIHLPLSHESNSFTETHSKSKTQFKSRKILTQRKKIIKKRGKAQKILQKRDMSTSTEGIVDTFVELTLHPGSTQFLRWQSKESELPSEVTSLVTKIEEIVKNSLQSFTYRMPDYWIIMSLVLAFGAAVYFTLKDQSLLMVAAIVFLALSNFGISYTRQIQYYKTKSDISHLIKEHKPMLRALGFITNFNIQYFRRPSPDKSRVYYQNSAKNSQNGNHFTSLNGLYVNLHLCKRLYNEQESLQYYISQYHRETGANFKQSRKSKNLLCEEEITSLNHKQNSSRNKQLNSPFQPNKSSIDKDKLDVVKTLQAGIEAFSPKLNSKGSILQKQLSNKYQNRQNLTEKTHNNNRVVMKKQKISSPVQEINHIHEQISNEQRSESLPIKCGVPPKVELFIPGMNDNSHNSDEIHSQKNNRNKQSVIRKCITPPNADFHFPPIDEDDDDSDNVINFSEDIDEFYFSESYRKRKKVEQEGKRAHDEDLNLSSYGLELEGLTARYRIRNIHHQGFQ